MAIQEVSPEQLAELVHHYHHALAPDFGCAENSKEGWEQVPQRQRSLMVAATRLALQELAAKAKEREDGKRYFAVPGEAEWGC
jgi:hypothetical protein